MQGSVDPNNLLSALHFQASGELLHLMEGFYSNIEDGLFEVAYSSDDKVQQRRLIELMRELRYRREHLVKTFGKRVQKSAQEWIAEDQLTPDYLEERQQAEEIAARCSSHFGGLLQLIAERVEHATGRYFDLDRIPIGPEQISYHFVMSCRSVEFDTSSIATVQDLFHRFVLERLGGVYGRINQQLEEAGYQTHMELEEAQAHSA